MYLKNINDLFGPDEIKEKASKTCNINDRSKKTTLLI